MDELLHQTKVILWKVMHFRWYAIATTSLILVAGWITVLFIPDNYQVKSIVYVDTQSILKPLLKGLAVDDTTQEEAALLMRRTLLARPNIDKVILQTDLDLTVTNAREMERLARSLATGITVSGHSNSRQPGTNIYRISYNNKNPETAYKVVDALLDVFLESTLGMTRQDSSSASRFMSQQIDDYRRRLDAADEAKKQFKIKHSGLLPDEQSNFYRRVETVKNQLQTAKLEQKELEFKATQLAEQLSGVNRETKAATAARDDRSVAAKIEELQYLLRNYRVSYTDDHPDVIATLSAIEGLESQVDNDIKPSTKRSSHVTIENPVYQGLSVLLGETKAELAASNARVEEYQRRLAELQPQIETIPQIETEYMALIRDYNVISETYQQLIQRNESAMIAEDAQRTGDTVQFRVIDPPTIPLTPIGPHRPILLSGILVLGIGAGVGIAVLMAEIKGAIYTKNRLMDTFSAPVLGEVSMTWSSAQLKTKKRDIFGVIGCVAAIIIVFTALIYYQLQIVGLPLREM